MEDSSQGSAPVTDAQEANDTPNTNIPAVTLNGAMVFPGAASPLHFSPPTTQKMVALLDKDPNAEVLFVTYREDADPARTDAENIYGVGTIARIMQLHREPAAGAAGEVGNEVDHFRRALLVGLDGQAIAFPAVQGRIGKGGGWTTNVGAGRDPGANERLLNLEEARHDVRVAMPRYRATGVARHQHIRRRPACLLGQ